MPRINKVSESKAEKIRTDGICPHDMKACGMAKRCDLAKDASCKPLLAGLAHSCGDCRRKFGACRWTCFRIRSKK